MLVVDGRAVFADEPVNAEATWLPFTNMRCANCYRVDCVDGRCIDDDHDDWKFWCSRCGHVWVVEGDDS